MELVSTPSSVQDTKACRENAVRNPSPGDTNAVQSSHLLACTATTNEVYVIKVIYASFATMNIIRPPKSVKLRFRFLPILTAVSNV